MKIRLIPALSIVLITLFYGCGAGRVVLPQQGICAHRGENQTNPENTISAFREAVSLGAHMIEFDVRMTKDGHLVIMHDKTVDRTTNGKGLVGELTLKQIKELDTGSWKSEKFKGERVPLLSEALEVIPKNMWINLHLKGDEKLVIATAKVLVEKNRTRQAFIACTADVLKGVRSVNPDILICNMERQADRSEYVEGTINGKFAFIQLLKKRNDSSLADDVKKLNDNNIIINYYHAETAEEVTELFDLGVNFILTNNLKEMLNVADSLGIKPNKQDKR